MSPIRRLSVVYLLCASAFTVLVAFDRDPALEHASRKTVAAALDAVRGNLIAPVVSFARNGSARLVAAVSGSDKPVARIAPARPAPKFAAVPKPAPVLIPPPARLAPPKPDLIAPQMPVASVPDIHVADAAPAPKFVTITPARRLKHEAAPAPELALVPPPAPPPSATSVSVSPAELVRVSERLKDNLTHEMLDNFSLFLYVSKADTGPWAQHMYVFRKDAGGDLTMLYNWPASTGRERIEIAADGTRQPSYTPQGYYQLDPGRMYTHHFSGQWHEPMPHAMFFNWQTGGLQTGLAIHGAVGLEVAQLGSRASAGCIRIAPENAALLFNLIRTQYKGLAPRFAIDRRTATMSNAGVMMHDPAGNVQLASGYKVLVFVENYGGENVVAALF